MFEVPGMMPARPACFVTHYGAVVLGKLVNAMLVQTLEVEIP